MVQTVPHFQEVVNSLSLRPSEVQDVYDVQKVLNVFLRRLNMSLTPESRERVVVFAEVQDVPDVYKVVNVFLRRFRISPTSRKS